MKKYVGVKQVRAEKCKAWKDAGGHKIGDDGYKVIYKDGYESWSPADVFEEAYREIHGLTFGMAIELLKKGFKMRRRGWNGKGIFIALKEPEPGSDMTHSFIYVDSTGVETDNPLAQKIRVPWLPGQADMLAEDWCIYLTEDEAKERGIIPDDLD